MGAGARLAEERDRWPDHWRVTDLDQEGERLLDVLNPTEELRAAVPGVLTSPPRGESSVLIGVTDQRVLVIGRSGTTPMGAPLSVGDATSCAVQLVDGTPLEFPGGKLELDLDEDALARLRAHVDGLRDAAGVG